MAQQMQTERAGGSQKQKKTGTRPTGTWSDESQALTASAVEGKAPPIAKENVRTAKVHQFILQ